jgi:hypothetical protein
MAKRHLKVTGDLGRVIFMVWALKVELQTPLRLSITGI